MTESLGTALRELAARHQPSLSRNAAVTEVRARTEARRRHRRTAVAVGTAAALVVLAAATVVLWPAAEDATVRTGEPTLPGTPPVSSVPEGLPPADVTEPGDAPSPALPPGATQLPPPPLARRGDVSLTWTGTEVVAWGGDLEAFNLGVPQLPDTTYNDGAAYNPTTGTWRSMAPSPLPAGSDEFVRSVWTGVEVLIVASGRAAAWNPDTDTWRGLADPPGGESPFPLELIWAGTKAVLLGPDAIYDPALDRWRPMPLRPVALTREDATWTGSEVVVAGHLASGQGLQAIAYDPETDRWRVTPISPQSSQLIDTTWDGERVVVTGTDVSAVAYVPDKDAWEPLPMLPAPASNCQVRTLAVGRSLLSARCNITAALDGGGTWIPLPPADVQIAGGETAYGLSFQNGEGDRPRMEFTAFVPDLDEGGRVRPPRVLAVGAVHLAVPPGFAFVSTSPSGVPTAAIQQSALSGPGGENCTVSSTYLGTFGESAYRDISMEPGVQEISLGSGSPFPALLVPTGRVVVQASSSDLVNIVCTDDATAQVLARHLLQPG